MSTTGSSSGFLDFVYELYTGMKAHEITLAYEGDINHQIMKAFIALAEGDMSKNAEPELIQKKVYHVMVECLQNISKHASHPELDNDSDYTRGILLVSRNHKEYNVTTGNTMEKTKIPRLKEMLEHVNSLSDTELNELYKRQLKEGRLSDKGGAGLGFIDIRRKTGRKLVFQFLPASDTHAFFLLSSTIPRNL